MLRKGAGYTLQVLAALWAFRYNGEALMSSVENNRDANNP